MAVWQNPAFVKDESSPQYKAFGYFLAYLQKDFIALSDEAYDKLTDHVQDICEHSYQEMQLRKRWQLEDQGLFVEPD